ncbi:MAG: hypothetical protein EYC68_04595 [Chloroflexota bacterium]|nr:MAG: hypothetical protein EYC68_04595 [Chloroflexota bacterium]
MTRIPKDARLFVSPKPFSPRAACATISHMGDAAANSDERRPVTILFTDIVGSTAHAEKLDAEEWKEIVNGAHRRVSEAVTRYEGTVAQLLGDGVLAFFGAPHAHEDDTARAVRAGLEIQRAISEYANELRGLVANFQMRVGINTGEVVVGAVGSADHSEYLAVGDTVNLAARLQSAAQPGAVLISENTARLVQSFFDLRDMGEISVKGKTEPLRVFEVIQERAGFASGRGIAGLSSPLVGRERELQELTAALNELHSGQGQIVFVLGEAGIGKTRLVEEGRRGTGDGGWGTENAVFSPTPDPQSPPPRFLEGRALSYGQSLSFWTITQLVQNDLGIVDGEHEIKIRVALKKRVQELFAEKSAEVFPYLAHLLGVKLEGEQAERVKILDGETLKRQVLLSLAEYFLKLAQKQPTVLVLEDLHWADPSSLDALERLLRVTERAPLMLIALMRAETDKPAWRIRDLVAREYRRRFHEIELEPLAANDANALVDNLLAIADLPDALRQMILARAEGNPLFLEEILRALMEQGTIQRDENNHWYAKSPVSNLHIPDTLQALLLARIDRLEEDVKRTLQLAAVIGRSFLFKLLEAISDAERELDWHLAQLERADLVHEKTRLPELEYMFKHSLTQQAAYASLVRERRQEFHRRVANALEKIFAERQEEFLGLLAYHFDRAGEKEKAIGYLIRAGDNARLSDAHEEAIAFYERAIELLRESGDAEREAKTWLKLGLIYHANFEFDKAHEANEKAFALEQTLRQQASRALSADSRRYDSPHVFRFSARGLLISLDPGLVSFEEELDIINAIFAGLAELDAELNVLPHTARSWEVLDGGRRYVFHLREDVSWTNGTRVTADDFEWAWKRNLAPATHSLSAELLDEIEGARNFREGRSSDPSKVGVRALDTLTLEVRLVKPIAYFPYLLTQPVTYPLPRAVIVKNGDQWWKPEHVVSNGAFQLVEFAREGISLERNPNYFAEFSGNLTRIETWHTLDIVANLQEYLQDRIEMCIANPHEQLSNPADFVSQEEQYPISKLGVAFLGLPPHPPLDDVRVRRALIHALDRERVSRASQGAELPAARGGIIPSGIAGHSPEIGLAFDLDHAQRLLAEAGYPKGRGFPPLILFSFADSDFVTENEIARQWREHLGIEVSLQIAELDVPEFDTQIHMNGWVADYPDPDNFLRNMSEYWQLRRAGWQNQRYFDLVETAASTPNRTERMALYREADRIWVAEDVVICPLVYFDKLAGVRLIKPWVKHWRSNRMGNVLYKHVRVEPH